MFLNLLVFLMQERFYFGDHVLPLFETGIPLLKQRLQRLSDADKVSIFKYKTQNHMPLFILFLLDSSVVDHSHNH